MNICIDINNYNSNSELCNDLIKNKVKSTVNACHPMLHLKNVYALFELYLAKILNTLNIPPPSKPSNSSIEIAKIIYDSLLSKEPIYNIDIEEPYYGKTPFRYEIPDEPFIVLLTKSIETIRDFLDLFEDSTIFTIEELHDNLNDPKYIIDIVDISNKLYSSGLPFLKDTDIRTLRTKINAMHIYMQTHSVDNIKKIRTNLNSIKNNNQLDEKQKKQKVQQLSDEFNGFKYDVQNKDVRKIFESDYFAWLSNPFPSVEIKPTSYTENNEYLHKRKCIYKNKKDYVIPHNCGYSYELVIYTTDLLKKNELIITLNKLVIPDSTCENIINLLLYYFGKMTIANGNHTFTECKETIIETITKIVTKIVASMYKERMHLEMVSKFTENFIENKFRKMIIDQINFHLYEKIKIINLSERLDFKRVFDKIPKDKTLLHGGYNDIQDKRISKRNRIPNYLSFFKLHTIKKDTILYRTFNVDDSSRLDITFDYKKCNGCWYTEDIKNAEGYLGNGNEDKVLMKYKVLEDIRLVEINDLKTWTKINDENKYSKISIMLNMCFPLINGKILRKSDYATDRKLLVLLCKKYDIHGWYHGDMMDPNDKIFPTEAAFCRLPKHFLEQLEKLQYKHDKIIHKNINNSVSSFRRSPRTRRQRR
jgi:hypothetical protein